MVTSFWSRNHPNQALKYNLSGKGHAQFTRALLSIASSPSFAFLFNSCTYLVAVPMNTIFFRCGTNTEEGTTQVAENDIEYNTMGAFQSSDKNTHGYYIVKWTGNAYTLQEKYKCHEFNPPVIIPGGELVCPAKFITPMKKPPIGITSQRKQSLSW